jgi:small subunit ribosomal protein S1
MEGKKLEAIIDRYIPEEGPPRIGSLVKGEVIGKTDTEIILDLGYKCEGVIGEDEIQNFFELKKVKLGEKLEGVITGRSDTGLYRVSFSTARQIKLWDALEECYHYRKKVKGIVKEIVKKGYSVDMGYGIMAFMPFKESDIENDVYGRKKLLNKQIEAYIIDFIKNKKILISRKQLMEEEAQRKKEEFLKNVKVGDVVKGEVKRIKNFGAFVDLGGIEGFVSARDITWGREKPDELLRRGQSIKAVVLEVDKEKEKIKLGIKQLTPDPWTLVGEKYKRGQKIKGKVISVTSFGGFIELEPGVEGMVHISELTWDTSLKKPSQVLKEGEIVEALILDLNPEKRRISLSIKALQKSPVEEFLDKNPPGSIVKAKVVKTKRSVVILQTTEGNVEAEMKAEDISWYERKDPRKEFKIGQEIEVCVLGKKEDGKAVMVGIKQMEKDPWERVAEKIKAGEIVEGVIKTVTDFGIFIEIEKGVEGLAPKRELPLKRDQNIKEVYKVGDKISAVLILFDKEKRKLILSPRLLQKKEEEEILEKYTGGKKGVKLGEMVGDIFNKKNE